MTDPNWPPDLVHPQDDPRSVNELISAALSEPNERLAWVAAYALEWRDTHQVLEEAARLCRSLCTIEQDLGAEILSRFGRKLAPDILARLGRTAPPFPEECIHLLCQMSRQVTKPVLLQSIMGALGHYQRPEVIDTILEFRRHEEFRVRVGVAVALSDCEDPRALEVLIELSRDEEAEVRYWATLSLVNRVELGTPELLEAIVARLSDPDDDTRGSALDALVRCGDRRVIPALRLALASDSVSNLEVEAASLIGEPELHPQLVALQRRRLGIDENLLKKAIRACAPTGIES